jgi:hypothetical protein
MQLAAIEGASNGQGGGSRVRMSMAANIVTLRGQANA